MLKTEARGYSTPEQFPRAIPVNQADINQKREWIRNADPSLEQSEQRANAESR